MTINQSQLIFAFLDVDGQFKLKHIDYRIITFVHNFKIKLLIYIYFLIFPYQLYIFGSLIKNMKLLFL